jgi:hypothetical protein
MEIKHLSPTLRGKSATAEISAAVAKWNRENGEKSPFVFVAFGEASQFRH